MYIINTLAKLYQTPFVCGYIDINADIRQQKEKLSATLCAICKKENPLKYSIELYKQMENESEIGFNCVSFKIPKDIIIVDTDDEQSEERVRNILNKQYGDAVVEKNCFPSISRALGINMKKGYHYYFIRDEELVFEKQKEQYKAGIHGDMDILGAGGDTSGFIIEHIDSEIPTEGISFVMKNELLNKICDKNPILNKIKSETDLSGEETSENIDELDEEYRNIEVWKKWVELMPNPDEITRQQWLTVAKFFKKYFPIEGFELFTIWSQKWAGYNSKNDGVLWNSSIDNNSVSVGSMIYLMKTYAKESLKKWRNFIDCKKAVVANVGVEQKNYFISSKIIEGGIYDIAEVMYKDIMEKAIYCNNEWYIFNDTENLWKVGKTGPTTIITRTVKKYFEWNIMKISEKLQDNDDKDSEKMRKYFIDHKKKLDTPSACSQFSTHLKTLNLNDKFKDELDQTKGKIAYQNGIYDIETDTFRSGIRYEDKLTFTLQFDYQRANPDAKERVRDILMKINSQEQWKYEYYIKMLGYALTGYTSREQVAFFCIGLTASNGKSTIFEALTKRMEGYVKKMKNDAFLVDNKKRHKYFSDIETCRIIWVNEIAKGQQDIDLIKDLSDGEVFKNEVLYGTEKTVQMNAKLFFVSNGEPKFASDEGIKRRYRYVEFKSKFFDNESDYNSSKKDPKIHYMKDPDVADFLRTDEGMNALLEILYDGARMYLKDGLKTPKIYDELKKEAIKSNDIYAEFINDNFREKEGKCIHKSEFADMWKNVGCCGNFKLDDFIEKMKIKGYIWGPQKNKKIGGKTKTGCFLNIEFIEADDDADEDD